MPIGNAIFFASMDLLKKTFMLKIKKLKYLKYPIVSNIEHTDNINIMRFTLSDVATASSSPLIYAIAIIKINSQN